MLAIVVSCLATAYLMVGGGLAYLCLDEEEAVRLFGNRYAGAFLMLLLWPIMIGLEV